MKCFSLPAGSALHDRLCCSVTSQSPGLSAWTSIISLLRHSYHFNPSNIIRFAWLPSFSHTRIKISLDGLPFQIPSLPTEVISTAWRGWVDSKPACTLIVTDASKDSFKMAVAAVNISDSNNYAALVPPTNSVFTGEALAVYVVVTCYTHRHGNYILLIDSMSILKALNNVSYKSPKVIWLLNNVLFHVSIRECTINLIWLWSSKNHFK